MRLQLNPYTQSVVRKNFGDITRYSPERLLSLGKWLLEKGRYAESELFFIELEKHSEFEELADLYDILTLSLSVSEGMKRINPWLNPFVKERDFLKENIESIVVEAKYCMAKSTLLHSEEKLPSKDFLEIELLIDRIPFISMAIEGRKEFNIVYNKFKEYALEVYLNQNERI